MSSPWDPPAQSNDPYQQNQNNPYLNQPTGGQPTGEQPTANQPGGEPTGMYPGAGGPTTGQPGAYGTDPSQFGQVPGQFGQTPGQFGQGPGAPQKKGGAKHALVSLFVIAVIAVGGFFVYKSIFKPGNQGSEGDVSSTKTVSVFDIRPGNCITEFPSVEQVTEVEVLPCAEPHTAEVYAELTLEDSSFTSEDDYHDRGLDFCEPLFIDQTAHLTDQELEHIGWWHMYPTQASWNAGDRLITCVAESDVMLTGSVTAGDVKFQ